MKRFFWSALVALSLTSCSKSSNNNNCSFLLNVGVNESVNLSLPQYSQLQFISNAVYVPNAGNQGIIVMNTGTGFVAWDASDPGHTPSSCSRLDIEGAEGVCGCDDGNTFSLFTGQPLEGSTSRCGLKAYRVEQSGNNLLITN